MAKPASALGGLLMGLSAFGVFLIIQLIEDASGHWELFVIWVLGFIGGIALGVGPESPSSDAMVISGLCMAGMISFTAWFYISDSDLEIAAPLAFGMALIAFFGMWLTVKAEQYI